MSPKMVMFFVLATLVPMLVQPSQAISIDECTQQLMDMSACYDYVTDNKVQQPLPQCCKALAAVSNTKPLCLCTVVNGDLAKAFGWNINQTRALALPATCNVQTPPVSLCGAQGSGSAPALAFSPSPSVGPAVAPSPWNSAGVSIQSATVFAIFAAAAAVFGLLVFQFY